MRYWIEQTYHLECSRSQVDRLFHSFLTWAGTSPVAQNVDDLDMGLSIGKDGIHEVHFSCSVDFIHGDEHLSTPTIRTRTFDVSEAATEANKVVAAFMSQHDVGTWRVHDGHTHLTSSEDGEDVEHPYLHMRVHHSEKDLSTLYFMPPAEASFSHHRE